MASPSHLPTEFVRTFARQAAADQRLQFVWIEGADESILWPPYEPLELHLAVAEPDLESVRQELPDWFCRVAPLSELQQQSTPLKGWAGQARLPDGSTLRWHLERTSQLGKVPRRAVNVLIDRSGGLLLPSFSYEMPTDD